MGCFVRAQLGKRMVLGYYSDSLMYTNLYPDKSLDSRYWSEVMSVSEKDFQTYAVHIRENVKDSNGRIHHTLIVAARFNPLRLINDP